MTLDVDTIAAVATAPGFGAIAVVRVSGPEALDVYRRLAPGTGEAPEPRRATLVELHDPADGALLDRAVATYFQAPASYTGEDVVELSVHGGPLLSGLVLAACMAAGARAAEPGEFTRRAYLRGKLDLIQAEAVADLVEARNRALHKAALMQLDRGLSTRIDALREGLVSLEALLAHHVDFPEEDDAPTPVDEIARRALGLLEQVDALLGTAPEGELLREGALTVLAGRPNAGKSSLYNALLGQERAIVTDEPGTTRDALEATVQIGGYPFRLVDTAGLRDPEGRVEELGIEVARRYLSGADMVLLCAPAEVELSQEELEFADGVAAPVVLVRTKTDLGRRSDEAGDSERFAAAVAVSVASGEGLDELQRVMPELAFSVLVGADEEAPVVTRRRQAAALGTARDEVAGFRRALSDGLPAEVAAAHLGSAASALEEVLGLISVEDVLDIVFREFCVGK